jgi:hypothetical protein
MKSFKSWLPFSEKSRGTVGGPVIDDDHFSRKWLIVQEHSKAVERYGQYSSLIKRGYYD